MLLAIDVYYNKQSAKTVGALFNWKDAIPQKIITSLHNNVLPYEPGNFYKRELPCILSLLKRVNLTEIHAIIIDGHCYVDNNSKYGLGAYLWEALDKKVPIIGVAKSKFKDTDQLSFPVFRGFSKKPLYVSAVQYNIENAINNVQSMHGNFRIPSILKTVDKETRVSY